MYLAPHFPHSHFSCSPVSPLFTCSSVSLFVCSPVFTFLCFSVYLCSLFHVFHVPSSLPFHVLCFPFPAFRCLFPQLFLSSFSSFFPRHYSSLQSYSSVLLISIRPHKSDGKQMPTSKHNRVITRTKYFFLALRMTKSI